MHATSNHAGAPDALRTALVDPLVELRARVDTRLEGFLAEALQQARERAADARPVVEAIGTLTMRGGKRLRPAFVLAAAECVAPWEQCATALVDVSAAVEILQTYLLIHDDWMDGDTVRRGGPTVHVALASAYGSPQRGAATAVLAGDMASALAQDLIAHAPLGHDRLAKVLQAFVAMQREVVLGQTLDVIDSADLDAICDLKTGSYTVRGPLALGLAVAGGSDEARGALERFAGPLGVAFQLRDDLIGTFGDERETGKSSSSDLRAGKRSAPVRYALERLDPGARSELESLLGRDDDTAVARARALVASAGAVEGLEQRIATLRRRALVALEHPALEAPGRALLSRLALLVTDRSK